MRIEIVYGDTNKQILLHCELSVNATVQTAIEQSGVLQEYPELKLTELVVGIFSKKCNFETLLQEGDRVEIYRALMIDPKEARRLRAKRIFLR